MNRTLRTVKSAFLVSVICFAATMFPENTNFAQNDAVKVNFEVDDKEVNQSFKLMLSVPGSPVFEPVISKKSFVFPPELRNSTWVQVRFVSGEYDLEYQDVHISKFDGEMIFGVDNAPFDDERVGDQPTRELILIYYLDTGSVCQTVFVYK